MAGLFMLVFYVTMIVSFFHGLIYAASHAAWTWFTVGFCFPPIAVFYGFIHWFV